MQKIDNNADILIIVEDTVPALFLSRKIIKRAHIIVLMSGKINIITGKFIYPFNCSASSTFIEPLFLKKITIIANPIAASLPII